MSLEAFQLSCNKNMECILFSCGVNQLLKTETDWFGQFGYFHVFGLDPKLTGHFQIP